ncbi:amino acid transporter [Jannaschia pagri]|uniref:Amino acid transporter n=1 Tax=Jannaschia pagri TaxID=2829797 RepID=A0ABQ4NKZ6_9RHOB|nr:MULTISPECIES: LysE family translocator [unclassified Jannaschia]GIT91258.1 amino acid transporter [Jannaschia sp. AI_61]GIT95091.1 amino acid transporter [Jannaschia sp. AI_62]
MSDILPHVPGLLAGLGIFAMGFLVIGPNLAAIIATSLAHGRRRGLAMSAGIAVGSGLWAAMTVAGLTALVAQYASAMTLLRYLGAAVLLWFAFKSFRAAVRPNPERQTATPVRGNAFLSGLTIQMTNPKAALQWVGIAAVALAPSAPWQVGALLIGMGMALSFAGHGAYAMAFSTAIVGTAYHRLRRWIDGALGVVLSTFALRLATERT